MRKLEIRSMPSKELRVATAADGTRSLSGYAVVFNSPSVDLGGFTEICAPGMFTRTLKDNPDTLCLRDHNPSLLMGRTKSGTLSLSEDANGLRFVCNLPDTTQAADMIASIERRDLDACSFGFNVVSDQWKTNPDKSITRTLNDVDLAEISITSFAAYPATSVNLRSCPVDVRSLLKRTNLDGCDCDCPECLDDDCENCSDDECEDPYCAENGCPAQDDDDEDDADDSERHRMYMCLELARRR